MFIILYWISRGFTEGWKWSKKPYKASYYHLMRLVEVVVIIFAIVFYKDFWALIGQSLIGVFIYERILMKVSKNVWFKENGWIFDIGLKITRYKWQDWFILGTGIGILTIL